MFVLLFLFVCLEIILFCLSRPQLNSKKKRKKRDGQQLKSIWHQTRKRDKSLTTKKKQKRYLKNIDVRRI